MSQSTPSRSLTQYGVDLTAPGLKSDCLNEGIQSPDHEIVVIKVGPSEHIFRLSVQHLNEIDYFRKAFTNGFKESSDRTLTLPGEDYEIFEIFVQWLYRGLTHEDLELTVQLVDVILYKGEAELRASEIASRTSIQEAASKCENVFDSISLTSSHPVRYVFAHLLEMRSPHGWVGYILDRIDEVDFASEMLRWRSAMLRLVRKQAHDTQRIRAERAGMILKALLFKHVGFSDGVFDLGLKQEVWESTMRDGVRLQFLKM